MLLRLVDEVIPGEAEVLLVAIEVDTSMGGSRVARVLERPAALRALPASIVMDNGPKSLARGARRLGVRERREAAFHPARQAR